MIVIRHSFISVKTKGIKSGAALRAARSLAIGSAIGHIKYIQHRPGNDREEKPRDVFTDREDVADSKVLREIVKDYNGRSVVIHKLTLAPEVSPNNPEEFTREVIKKLGDERGLDLQWWAVCHRNTDNHHIHVVVLSKDRDGQQVRFDKNDYDRMKEFGDEYLERTQYFDCRAADLRREEKYKQKQKDLERLRQERIFNGEELPYLHSKIVREQLEPYSEWIKKQPIDSKDSFEHQGEKYTRKDKLERLIALQASLRNKSKKEDKLSKDDYALMTKWIEIKDRARFGGEVERQFNNANRAHDQSVKRANSPDAHRWVHPLQAQVMKNPIMGLFMSAASLANEIVRSIPLTEGGEINDDNKKRKDKDRDLDNMG